MRLRELVREGAVVERASWAVAAHAIRAGAASSGTHDAAVRCAGAAEATGIAGIASLEAARAAAHEG